MYAHADRGFKAQGIDRKKLLYYNPLQPYLAYWGTFWLFIFILINGFTVFFKFNVSLFITSCTCCVLCCLLSSPALL